MTKDTGTDPTRYWRDKYLDLLDEHEKLESKSQQQEENLRRALLVTTAIAQSQSKEVDSSLNKLRIALSPGASGLATSIDGLKRTINNFEEEHKQRTELVSGLIRDISVKIDECPIPKEIKSKSKHIRRKASTDLQLWSGYAIQLINWLEILGDIITLEGYDKEQQSNWWKRWFKDQKTKEQAELQTDIQEPGFSAISQDVTETLRELIDQISVPERLGHQQENLHSRLESDLPWFEVVPLLEETSTFILQCLANSQVNIEEFLQSLDTRLQAIREVVIGASSGRSERTKARELLTTMVQDQLADIRSVVAGTTDLKLLSQNVSSHLLLIVEAMDRYREDEDHREARLTAQLEQLQERLAEMEKEVGENRQAFEEQKHKATHDNLTGLPNREAYNLRLTDEMARYHRYGNPLSLIICDVDHFKRINDTYGHLAGDKVLQLIARTLRKRIRDVDFVARFGGEEFVILMPETTAQEAKVAAEKLRQSIEESPFNFKKERVFITMSFGIAEFTKEESADQVFERADRALYKAKETGRNQCVICKE